MKRYSKNKNIHKIVFKLLKEGWCYRSGKKHGVIISPAGFRMAVPGTPSDSRAYKNFKQSVAMIAAKGF